MIHKTFYIEFLGCDKNHVDAERLAGEIVAHGCTITEDPDEAEIIIVNSCAFINAARQESINVLLECGEYREGKTEKIVLTGCLPEKFIKKLYPALTEADVFLGVDDASALFPALERAYAGERVNAVGKGTGERGPRACTSCTSGPYVRYLKIAEGCSNRCTYCLIPKIRGNYVSYPMEELVAEAVSLGEVKELILVAQDTTRYGEDRGKNEFVPLIQKLSALENIGHIRLLYCYPEAITDELIAEVKNNPKVLKYLDIPMQHCEDRILKLMGRRSRKAELVSLIEKLRREIPEIALRTTFITGFPSETEEEHRALISFLREQKLENCGFFMYSREPETPAYKMAGQIHRSTKERRLRELYNAQSVISAEYLQKYIGKTLPVLYEFGRGDLFGRAYFQAPDIDGGVCFHTELPIREGDIVPVKITRIGTYDLYGDCESLE